MLRYFLQMCTGMTSFISHALIPRTFQIIMDHKPLKGLFSPTRPILITLPSKIIRWSLLMSSYDYNIMYKLGTSIVATDAMRHLPLQENLQVPILGCIIHQIHHLDDTTVDATDICKCTSKDTESFQRSAKLYNQEQI